MPKPACATAVRRFELRDGNLGLMGKKLRLIPLTGRFVADLERYCARRATLSPGRCFPGGHRGVIEPFSAPITDHGRTARGHLYRCAPATYILELASLRGTLSGAGAPIYQF